MAATEHLTQDVVKVNLLKDYLESNNHKMNENRKLDFTEFVQE